MTVLAQGWNNQIKSYNTKTDRKLPDGADKYVAAAKKLDQVWNDPAKFVTQFSAFCTVYDKWCTTLTKAVKEAKSAGGVRYKELKALKGILTGSMDLADKQLETAKQAKIASEMANKGVISGIKLAGTEGATMKKEAVLYGGKSTPLKSFTNFGQAAERIGKVLTSSSTIDTTLAKTVAEKVKKDPEMDTAYVKFGMINGDLIMRIKRPKNGRVPQKNVDVKVMKGFAAEYQRAQALRKEVDSLTFASTVEPNGKHVKKYLPMFHAWCKKEGGRNGIIALEFYLRTAEHAKLPGEAKQDLIEKYIANGQLNIGNVLGKQVLGQFSAAQGDTAAIKAIDFSNVHREARGLVQERFSNWKQGIR